MTLPRTKSFSHSTTNKKKRKKSIIGVFATCEQSQYTAFEVKKKNDT